MRRIHARYGPEDRYSSPPGAGMCISVFALVKRRGKVLVGIPAPHERWMTEWLSSWRHHSEAELAELQRQTRLPSTYIFEGEHPDSELGRVMRDQLGVRSFEASAPRVMSYVSPSDWYPGNSHWDLALVYPVKISGPLNRKKLSWWKELAFLGPRELKKRKLGWNQDMMEDLGLA